MTVQLANYPKVNNDVEGSTMYEDVITHCKDWKHYAVDSLPETN